MAPCSSHTVGHYFVLCKKSLAQKLSDELHFFKNSCIFPFVTFTVTAGQGSGCEMKGYEFLSVNNCNYRPIWHRY